jgi:hypothetical protein
MFQLDENFLNQVGLKDLPKDQVGPFLQHIYEELELRVGTRLSEGLSDTQLEEFEAVIDRKMEIVKPWLQANVINYKNDPLFLRLKTTNNLSDDDPGLLSEFAATKWLEVNRSDYRDVVGRVLEELKKEISDNSKEILGKS